MDELQPLVGSDGRVPLTCFRNALVNAPLLSRVLNSLTPQGELPASSFQSFSPDPVRDILTVQRTRERVASESLRRLGSSAGFPRRESIVSESHRNSPLDNYGGEGPIRMHGPCGCALLSRRPPTLDPQEHDEPRWYTITGQEGRPETTELIPL